MLRCLAITAIATFLAVAPAAPQPDKTADKDNQHNPNSQPEKQANRDANQSKTSPDPPKWYAPLQKPDWWVVIVAGLTGIVIGWQSFETRRAAAATERSIRAVRRQSRLMERQTEILERSVAVAERAADSAANAERARLVIEYSTPEPFVLEIKAYNSGRSSARLTFTWVQFRNLKWDEHLPDAPPYDPTDDDWMDTERWVLPGKSTSLLFKDAMSVLDVSKNGIFYSPQEHDDLVDCKTRIWVFGFIRYLDTVSNDEKRTHFCHYCLWNEDGTIEEMVPDGPSAYYLET